MGSCVGKTNAEKIKIQNRREDELNSAFKMAKLQMLCVELNKKAAVGGPGLVGGHVSDHWFMTSLGHVSA